MTIGVTSMDFVLRVQNVEIIAVDALIQLVEPKWSIRGD